MTQQEIDDWFTMMHEVKMEFLCDVVAKLRIELMEVICGANFWFSVFALGDVDAL